MTANPSAEIHTIEGSSAIYMASKKVYDKPSKPIDQDENKIADDIAKWYDDDNLHPQNVIKDIESNSQLSSQLGWMARAVISGGLVYGYEKKVGEKVVFEQADPNDHPEIKEFLTNSNVKKQLWKLSTEFYRFWNVWIEMLRSKDRKKIAGLKVHQSAFCRWGKQNKDGEKDRVYIHPNWENNPPKDDKAMIKLKAVDPDYCPEEQVSDIKDRKFIYPVAGPSSGYVYYEKAPWDPVRTTWLPVANKIPKFKQAIMDNGMALRYLVIMPDYWMSWKYQEEWEGYKPDKKRELIEKEFQAFNDFLTKVENAGKSIMVAAKTDPVSGQSYESWKIEPIKGNLMEGSYNDDSEIASNYISNSLGIYGSLASTSPGKNGLGSKGSELRNLFNMYIANSKPEQDAMLEVMEFIKRYNGWDQNLTFWFRNYYLTTLDQSKPEDRNFNADSEAA